MPIFRVPYQVSKVFTDGSIEVEAASMEAAAELVGDFETARLIEGTFGAEFVIDVHDDLIEEVLDGDNL